MRKHKLPDIHHSAFITHHCSPIFSMLNARPSGLARALALVLLATLTASGRAARADGAAGAGVLISNRAEAFYTGSDGQGYTTVSPTISVTVLTVAAVTVTPDETDPSATVAPRAAPVPFHFDADASGTVNGADRLVELGTTMSPRLARGQCVGVLAT